MQTFQTAAKELQEMAKPGKGGKENFNENRNELMEHVQCLQKENQYLRDVVTNTAIMKTENNK